MPPDSPDGLRRRPSGLRGLATRHPLAADTLLVVALGVITGPSSILAHHPWEVGAVLHVLLWVPLVWRRRAPEGVFLFCASVAFVQWLIGVRLSGDFALLIALYTVAAHRPRERARLAAGVLEVGVLMAAARWSATHIGSIIATIVFLTGLVLAAFFIGVNMRTRRAHLAALIDRAERLERERDQQTRLAAAAERARIAREMHDIVAHSLSVIVTLADAATVAGRSHPDEAEAAMRQVSATGRAALAETRRLLGVLRDAQAGATDLPAAQDGADADERRPQPDVARLDDLLATVRTTGLAAALTVTGKPFPLPATAQTTVYRIVQEALTNTLKHAVQPRRVRVGLRYDAPHLDVEVCDDGRGGDAMASLGPAAAAAGPGHGLTGMRERAAMFGGTVDAGAQPTGGWRVAARLCIDEAEPA